MRTIYPIASATSSNGIHVIVNPDPWVPGVAVNLWYGVGSADETPTHTGLAHLFEHLMFSGSANVATGEHLSLIQSVGGNTNATTSFDRTNYYDTVPTGALELALWLEADRLGSLLDRVDQVNLDTQRAVVEEEKRQRYDNVPYGDAFQHLMSLCFPADHPYSHTPIGSMEDLDAATLEDVHEFFRTHYSPDKLTLALSGAITPEQGFELVETYFGHIPRGENPPTLPSMKSPVSPPEGAQREVVANVPQDAVYCSWVTPPVTDPTTDAFTLGLSVLTEGLTARLHKALVVTGLADSVDAFDLGLARGASLVSVVATCDEDTTPAEVESVMMAAWDDFCAHGPNPAEVERAQISEERECLADLASIETRADAMCEAALVFSDPDDVNTYLDRIWAVTPDDVGHAFSQWLDPRKRAVLTYRRSEAEKQEGGQP
ncbi:MAG: insulinase family protein [Propionibacteriaceae bacterium]|jgi:predicted Zn-dependent peptidase|nr:insulinase family protein [Propionibacteriaceae bacterium]